MTKGFGELNRIEHRLRRDMNRRYRAVVIAFRIVKTLAVLAAIGIIVWWFAQTVGDRLDRVPGHGAYSAEALLVRAEIERMAPPVIVREDGLAPVAGETFYIVHSAQGYEPTDPAYCPE